MESPFTHIGAGITLIIFALGINPAWVILVYLGGLLTWIFIGTGKSVPTNRRLLFGGGYAIVALIRYVVVQQYAWLTDLEFLDVLAVSQITPGPIAINTATFVGYLMGGIWGSIVATFSSIAVPFLLVYSMSSLLNRLIPSTWICFLTT